MTLFTYLYAERDRDILNEIVTLYLCPFSLFSLSPFTLFIPLRPLSSFPPHSPSLPTLSPFQSAYLKIDSQQISVPFSSLSSSYYQAKSRFVVCTQHGALGRKDGTYGDKNFTEGNITDREAAWCHSGVSDGTPLVEVMKSFKPTVLMGMTATAGVFTEELVRAMASQCDRPIIMPMSNPTAKAECTAAQGTGLVS